MMLSLSMPGLFFCLAVLVPLLWAGLVLVARRLGAGKGLLSERAEKILLLLMVVPGLLGALVVLAPGLMPDVPSPLPDWGVEDMGFAPAGEVATAAVALPRASLPVWGGLLALYGAGSALSFVRLVAGYIRLRRISGRAALTDEAFPDVRLTDARLSPFATPKGEVVLPRSFIEAASGDERDMIIAHERAHIGRRDPHWFLALAGLEAIFWANPFVRLQASRCRLAAELACDRDVLREAPQWRKQYAALLIRVLRHSSGRMPSCAPAFFSPRNKGDYEMRLGNIMRPRMGEARRRGVAVLAAVGVGLAPLAVWQVAQAADTAAVFSVRPVEGKRSSDFGMRIHPVTKEEKLHRGVDIAAPKGTPIHAPASGKVVRVMLSDSGYGNLLELDHGDGVVTRYGQLDTIVVDGKVTVEAGEVIARVGSSGQSTGPHLHIEVVVDGEFVDPDTVLDLPGKAE